MNHLPHISRAESVVLGVYTPSTSRLHSPTALVHKQRTLQKSTTRHHSSPIRSQDMACRGRMSTASHHILHPPVSLETKRLSIAKIRLHTTKEARLPDQHSI